MFERFTEDAKEVSSYAQEYARNLKHNYIGTEHILLGLLSIHPTAKLLSDVGISLSSVKKSVQTIVGTGDELPVGSLVFTPRAKKVITNTLKESLYLGSKTIEARHILLALIQDEEGVAARILSDTNVDFSVIRSHVLNSLLSGHVQVPVYVLQVESLLKQMQKSMNETISEITKILQDKGA